MFLPCPVVLESGVRKVGVCQVSRPWTWSTGRIAGRAHRKILWFSGLRLILEPEPRFSPPWPLLVCRRCPPTPCSPLGRRALQTAAQSLVTSHPDGAGSGKETPQVERTLNSNMTGPVSPPWSLAREPRRPRLRAYFPGKPPNQILDGRVSA
ncbi:hypothetical protein NN561_005511 [Cricetulus griseus]